MLAEIIKKILDLAEITFFDLNRRGISKRQSRRISRPIKTKKEQLPQQDSRIIDSGGPEGGSVVFSKSQGKI
jgi:hypothetical protein